jgi:hypothetical protein
LYRWKKKIESSVTATVEVGSGRFELPTSTMSTWRSNQLSYEPNTAHKYTKACQSIAIEKQIGSFGCAESFVFF